MTWCSSSNNNSKYTVSGFITGFVFSLWLSFNVYKCIWDINSMSVHLLHFIIWQNISTISLQTCHLNFFKLYFFHTMASQVAKSFCLHLQILWQNLRSHCCCCQRWTLSIQETIWVVSLQYVPDHDQVWKHSKKPILHPPQCCLSLLQVWKHLQNILVVWHLIIFLLIAKWSVVLLETIFTNYTQAMFWMLL